MKIVENEIRLIAPRELEKFFIYLNDHLSDSGKEGSPLFQPLSRNNSRLPKEKEESFSKGLSIPVGQVGWRRVWIAVDQNEEILGHIDLRAHTDQYIEHRALLGMGVDRKYRRVGLGKRLIETVTSWAVSETAIEWVDLWVLSGNTAAVHLYESTGFHRLGEVDDMFRIDGASEANTLMTKGILGEIV
jgi:ribosomal protein S18 acetylase RimI-like enzyme